MPQCRMRRPTAGSAMPWSKAGSTTIFLAEVCRRIEGHGLELKEAEVAIIDATLVESATRPRTISRLRRTEPNVMRRMTRRCISAPMCMPVG